jgi:hypothetical protein
MDKRVGEKSPSFPSAIRVVSDLGTNRLYSFLGFRVSVTFKNK